MTPVKCENLFERLSTKWASCITGLIVCQYSVRKRKKVLTFFNKKLFRVILLTHLLLTCLSRLSPTHSPVTCAVLPRKESKYSLVFWCKTQVDKKTFCGYRTFQISFKGQLSQFLILYYNCCGRMKKIRIEPLDLIFLNYLSDLVCPLLTV